MQIVYRVRKNIALGSDKSCVRKVQDGVRGEIVNQSIRIYDPKYFPFYNSHTKSNAHAKELNAQDIKPIWKHWTFMIGIPLLLVGLYNLFTMPSILKPPVKTNVSSNHSAVPAPAASVAPVPAPSQDNTLKKLQSKIKEDDNLEPSHPFYKLQMHIGGFIETEDKKRFIYNVLLSQNGQVMSSITDKELTASGYTVERISPCVFKVIYKNFYDFITCDSPRVSPVSKNEITSSAKI